MGERSQSMPAALTPALRPTVGFLRELGGGVEGAGSSQSGGAGGHEGLSLPLFYPPPKCCLVRYGGTQF